MAQEHRSVRYAAQLPIVRLCAEQNGAREATGCVSVQPSFSVFFSSSALLCAPRGRFSASARGAGSRASRLISRVISIARHRFKGSYDRGSARARETRSPRLVAATRAPNLTLVPQKIVCHPARRWKEKERRLTPSPRPPSSALSAAGTIFLFDRKAVRFFRKDGHDWQKKKDGKTVRETHEKLKVGNVELLNCYYAHAAENNRFQRRCYWLLDSDEGVVLVHYLDTTTVVGGRGGAKAAGLSAPGSNGGAADGEDQNGFRNLFGYEVSGSGYEEGSVGGMSGSMLVFTSNMLFRLLNKMRLVRLLMSVN